jgi:hypothetical protein
VLALTSAFEAKAIAPAPVLVTIVASPQGSSALRWRDHECDRASRRVRHSSLWTP